MVVSLIRLLFCGGQPGATSQAPSVVVPNVMFIAFLSHLSISASPVLAVLRVLEHEWRILAGFLSMFAVFETGVQAALQVREVHKQAFLGNTPAHWIELPVSTLEFDFQLAGGAPWPAGPKNEMYIILCRISGSVENLSFAGRSGPQ